MEVKAFVNGCRVLHSGSIHIVGTTAQLNVDGLVVNLIFIDDNGGQRWVLEGKVNSADFKIYNVSGAIPEGVVEPIQFASNPGGVFFLTFLSAVMDKAKQYRSLDYTILYKEKSNG